MTAQAGKDLLLKIRDPDGSYRTVAGLRSKQLSINSETIDITHSNSPRRWRQLLEGAGVKRMSISGNGIFTDSQVEHTMHQLLLNGLAAHWKVIIPPSLSFEGAFMVSSLELAGSYVGEISYDIALQSAGEITLTNVRGPSSGGTNDALLNPNDDFNPDQPPVSDSSLAAGESS